MLDFALTRLITVSGIHANYIAAASAIIQMPFRRDAPDFYLSREDLRDIRDVVHHFHGGDEFDEPKKKRILSQDNERRLHQLSLAMRLKYAPSAGDSVGGDREPVPEQSAASTQLADSSPCAIGLLPDGRPSLSTNDLPEEEDNTEEGSSADPALVSDSDYELVPRPASVDSTSSESDPDISMPNQSLSTATLLIRNATSSAESVEHVGRLDDQTSESSDSEWSLL